jgi:hypothetical protein
MFKKTAFACAAVLLAASAHATVTFSITVNIPDADAPDLIAAAREVYATNGTPNPTQAQIVAAKKAEVVAWFRAITKAYRQRQAAVGVVEPEAN